jgi:hypothetical protein
MCCSSARQSHAFDEGIVAWRVISKQILLRPKLSVLDTRRHFADELMTKQMNRTLDFVVLVVVLLLGGSLLMVFEVPIIGIQSTNWYSNSKYQLVFKVPIGIQSTNWYSNSKYQLVFEVPIGI